MRSWSIPEMYSLSCYKWDRLEELSDGQERRTTLDLLKDSRIPIKDKLWLCCREHVYRGPWVQAMLVQCEYRPDDIFLLYDILTRSVRAGLVSAETLVDLMVDLLESSETPR